MILEEQKKIFDEVVNSNYNGLRRMVDRAIFNPNDRDDILQSGLLAFFTAIPNFRNECSGFDYAKKCLGYKIKNYIRACKSPQRRAELDKEYFEDPSEMEITDIMLSEAIIESKQNNPELAYQKKEKQMTIDNALNRLAELEQKQAEACQIIVDFFRKYEDNIKDSELAALLNVPVNSIKKLKFNARKNLREIMNEEDWYW